MPGNCIEALGNERVGTGMDGHRETEFLRLFVERPEVRNAEEKPMLSAVQIHCDRTVIFPESSSLIPGWMSSVGRFNAHSSRFLAPSVDVAIQRFHDCARATSADGLSTSTPTQKVEYITWTSTPALSIHPTRASRSCRITDPAGNVA